LPGNPAVAITGPKGDKGERGPPGPAGYVQLNHTQSFTGNISTKTEMAEAIKGDKVCRFFTIYFYFNDSQFNLQNCLPGFERRKR
jgi:hypothetical protein